MKLLRLCFVFLAVHVHAAYADKNEQLINQGKNLYNQHCLMCHGTSGAGDGPVGSNLSKKIQPLKKSAEKQIVDVLNGGKKDVMPDYRSTLSADQKQALAKYMTEVLLNK